MSSNWHFHPATRGNAPARRPADEATRLVPVLVRALETGRGPPGLMSWLAGRHGAGAPDRTVTELAAELNRALRRAGVTETLAD